MSASEPARVGDQSEMAALVAEHEPMLRRIAKSIARRIGEQMEVDELLSYAWPALVEAARTYDQRGNFTGYAAQRVKWAMLDGARAETQSRRIAARARSLGASELFASSYRDDAPDAQPQAESVYRDRLATLLAGHAAAMAVGLLAESAGDELVAPDENPEAATLRREASLRLRRAVGKLPDRQRELVERHYFGGERFDEIAASLGISKSWASRLHAQAMGELGKAIANLR